MSRSRRLIKERKLLGYRYDRFWVMDTFKEQQQLTDLYKSGCAPWEVWKPQRKRLRIPDAPAVPCRRGPGSNCSASAPTATTWRSAAAAPSFGCCDELPIDRVTWVVLSGNADRAAEAERSASGCSMVGGTRGSNSSSAAFRDGYFPYTAAPIKEFFESAEAASRSPTSSSPTTATTGTRTIASSPSCTYNTFRDHLDPRVRDHEAGRRPRSAQHLRAARRRNRRSARSST